MFQWEDGTIAYYPKQQNYALQGSCSFLRYAGDIVSTWCVNYIPTYHALCEADGTLANIQHNADVKVRLPSQSPANLSVPFPHVVCPSMHWTHELLACDVQSACFRPQGFRRDGTRDVRNRVTSQCQSPLSRLFPCRSGAGRVPYSLVCDHSRDCLDSSDEDFCVHPSCSDSGQFECVNMQVSS